MGKGGDVFVLDMGESVKIIDLARKMISLAGMSVSENGLSGDIKIEFTGLRPGEKLYEELLIGDNVTGTDHPRIMRAIESCISVETLDALFVELHQAAQSYDVARLKVLLKDHVEGYVPDMNVLGLMKVADAIA
jgi:FlaA1/EpsC-like NDP-sugar epimerase